MDLGKIELENKKIINWGYLTDEKPLQMPFGTAVELSVAFNENDFISGRDGIVWASYDQRQIDIIKNALFAQNIIAEVQNLKLGSHKMFVMIISNNKDLTEAIDFIWRSKTGLRLKPDWTYPNGNINESFELWLSGQ